MKLKSLVAASFLGIFILTAYFVTTMYSSQEVFGQQDRPIYVEATKEWQWVRIPDTKLIDVLPPESFTQPIKKTTGPGAIVGAWSGGAFDTKRNRLMVIGGGHEDYCGNEWLAFDLNEFRWKLLSGPSDLTDYDDTSGRTPDGNPASRHTYGGLTYLPSTDKLLMHGGALCNPSGTPDNRWWLGDPADGGWSFGGGRNGWILGYSSAYDSYSDQVFVFRRGPLYSYSMGSNSWTRLTTHGDIGKSNLSSDIDPKRRKFLLIGQGEMLVFDLASYERTSLENHNNHPVVAANAPGLAYVKKMDRYVAWSGGQSVYLIHPETWEIQPIETSGANPPMAAKNGTFGRFRYSPKSNGIILVNSVKDDVFFLALPDDEFNVQEKLSTDDQHNDAERGHENAEHSTEKVTSQRIVETAGAPGNTVEKNRVTFGSVWCPREYNGGEDYTRVTDFKNLPNDPIGDGKNNCYMEAFDTSVFSTDGKPLRNCGNLDLKHFPEHTCHTVATPSEFRALSRKNKLVAIITQDLAIAQGEEPYLSRNQQSLVVIGVFDTATRKPVLIEQGKPVPSTFFNWNVSSQSSQLILINLRMVGSQCILVSDRGKVREITGISLTGKCRGRFIMASNEQTNRTSRVDNKIYLRNIMARSRNSHTIYLDRTFLNWVEDSIILGSWTPGKHAAKYTGQNVVLKNSIHSNQGVHGQPIVDPAYAESKRPWLGKGGLAPISLTSCNRAVIDGVTVVNHIIRGNSNPQAIQWQFRDALGAGCDMPRLYRSPPDGGAHEPFYGPTWTNGVLEEPSSAWQASFWEAPPLFESYVINSTVIQSYGAEKSGHGGHYALMSNGTYPSVRDSSSVSERRPAELIPPGWIERQRIHVSGNCLDNGVNPNSLFKRHILRGMGEKGRHRYDNTPLFIGYGSNTCSANEEVSEKVSADVSQYLRSIPAPPWESWRRTTVE
tara:strand:+ start:594 stop:3431 length:2838 start_codon:yes stop_codon:yes gene_type:complete